jgi:hypothetical protein
MVELVELGNRYNRLQEESKGDKLTGLSHETPRKKECCQQHYE